MTATLAMIDKLIDYAVAARNLPTAIHVPANEKFLRRKLKLKKGTELRYRGFALVPTGSARDRKRREDQLETDFKAAQLDFCAEGNR